MVIFSVRGGLKIFGYFSFFEHQIWNLYFLTASFYMTSPIGHTKSSSRSPEAATIVIFHPSMLMLLNVCG